MGEGPTDGQGQDQGYAEHESGEDHQRSRPIDEMRQASGGSAYSAHIGRRSVSGGG